jgi:hypothetical protein
MLFIVEDTSRFARDPVVREARRSAVDALGQ